ncbi:MAG: hypothetical protein METHP_00652 [Methanoregula sp. SKADARSKE-2]|nr:MAG: hypothetical protein METHP_00652 [Methanoregula sp. SKADARSKE-2]
MAKFVCSLCGKCCGSLGSYIVIERGMGARNFYCRNGITGELFPAYIQPEYADEFEKRSAEEAAGTSGSPVTACAFLVRNPGAGGYGCAIHPTRPRLCREFRCYHMNIYDTMGGLRGRVIGQNAIRTPDASLETFWNEHIAPLPCSNRPGSRDPDWTRKVLALLASRGYRGDPVE